jgi:hypothetical protein
VVQLNRKEISRIVWNVYLLTVSITCPQEGSLDHNSSNLNGLGRKHEVVFVLREMGLDLNLEHEGESKRNLGEEEPKGRSQPSIQPLFDVFQTYYVVRPGEWISSKSNIYHTKMIYKPSKRAIGRTRNKPATNFIRLIHN